MILAEAQTLAVDLSNRVGNGQILTREEAILLALQEISDLLVPVLEYYDLIRLKRDNGVELGETDKAIVLLLHYNLSPRT